MAKEPHLTDLLLITDIPRLMQLFSRLEQGGQTQVRVASSLDAGSDELVRQKPAAVLVQAHLSGLSPDILLTHLKKQLGRKRTRFILLAASPEAAADSGSAYHAAVDTSLSDNAVLEEVVRLLNEARPAARKKSAGDSPADVPVVEPAMTPDFSMNDVVKVTSLQASEAADERQRSLVLPAAPAASAGEEEVGTYGARNRLKVYSEFNASFDEAVTGLQPSVVAHEAEEQPVSKGWADAQEPEDVPPPSRSRMATFLIWCVPVLAIAIVVTMLQQRSSEPPKQKKSEQPAVPKAAPAPAAAIPATPVPPAVGVSSAPPAPTVVKPAAEADARLSDKAVISAISESRPKKSAAPAAGENTRPRELPDFIPRSGLDKAYGAANPGWERYKGKVTEFKVLREPDGRIKAIQVIDRGGAGVPESFMKGVLKQVAQQAAFTLETTEHQEGYVIQRGRLTEQLKVVYYRDEKGLRLRAFAVTWQ